MQTAKNSVRFGRRTPLGSSVTLRAVDTASGRGIIRNASISGAFVETTLALPLHTNLVVIPDLPANDATAPHRLNACVVRLDPLGLGVEWRDMASRDVVELMRRNVAAPDADQGQKDRAIAP